VKDPRVYLGQWQFQTAHLRGRILNVGCNTDGGKLRERFGAINVDLALRDDANGGEIPANVLADARALPFARASFDTVVLGEILEHFTDADAIRTLVESKALLRNQGRIVVTIPHDNRSPNQQGYAKYWDIPYAPGVPRFHPRELTKFDLFDWLKKAGLALVSWARIQYVYCGLFGTGAVAIPEGAC
jgi:Methyltransferase domain